MEEHSRLCRWNYNNEWSYSGKLQLGDRLIKGARPVIISNAISCLQMKSVGSHSTSGREKEGKGWDYITHFEIIQLFI